MLCGGGGVSMGNCRKDFMSRWGWIIAGVRRKVGTAAPARFMPPAPGKAESSINIPFRSKSETAITTALTKNLITVFLF